MFNIPNDLTVFSTSGLEDILRVATDELKALRASVPDPATMDDETLARVKELHAFGLAGQAEVAKRQARVAEFNSTELPELEAPVEPVVEPVLEPVTAAAPAVVEPVIVPSIADIVRQSPQAIDLPSGDDDNWMGEFHSLVAANNIPGVSDGREMASWKDFATAFSNRTRSYSGKSPLQHPIAELRRNFPAEFTLTEDMNDEAQYAVFKHASDESRLEGGSLVAANGWCAPSETLYSTCLQIGSDGMWQGPEVIARRGGIRHNQGIEFDTIFGTGVGFNILTEAQVIADTPKTCVEIPCPPFVDDRLDVSVLCLTGSILQNRAYPEFVETFIRGALATFAHFVNRSIIAQIVAGSVAVAPSTVDPWATDNSLISNLLGIVEMAIVDIQYRLRLNQNTTVEIVLPYWIKAMMRQDFSRRTGFDGVGLADADIDRWFSMRNARVQYVYDWQDSFSGVATGPGADTPILTLPALVTPKQVQFLAYPAGTWVLARLDVIRLESIYDSVNLPQNLVTQLFLEDGFKPMRMCPLSRVYTVNICPSGATSALQTVACTDITP